MVKRLFICLILACSWTTASAGFTPFQHTIGLLLTGEHATDITVGAEMLHSAQLEFAYNRQVDNQQLFDLAAYILDRDMNDPERAQATAWLAKALAQTGNARYRAVVEQAASEKSPRRLRGHAKKALRKFGDSESSEPFTPDSFDLPAMKEALDESTAGVPATTEGFAELKPADSLETTYAVAGLPSSANAHPEQVYRRFHRQTFQLNYHGIGVAWFDPDNVRNTYTTSPLYNDFDIKRYPRLINQLFTNDTALVRSAAIELSRLDDPIPDEELDAMTYIAWTRRDAKSELELETMAWLCHAVEKADNPRYRSAFKKIAGHVEDTKLRRRAERVADVPSNPDVEQFDPESIEVKTPSN